MTEEELEQRRRTVVEEAKRMITAAGREERDLTDAETARMRALQAENAAVRVELDDRFYRDYMNRPRPDGVKRFRRDAG